ncbi:MAG: hypothetical protein AAF483_02620 [Planctomycetota bacterium]
MSTVIFDPLDLPFAGASSFLLRSNPRMNYAPCYLSLLDDKLEGVEISGKETKAKFLVSERAQISELVLFRQDKQGLPVNVQSIAASKNWDGVISSNQIDWKRVTGGMWLPKELLFSYVRGKPQEPVGRGEWKLRAHWVIDGVPPTVFATEEAYVPSSELRLNILESGILKDK